MKHSQIVPNIVFGLAVLLVAACSSSPTAAPSTAGSIKKVAAGSEFSGFLKNYSELKPNAALGAGVLTFANMDQAKHLRRYVAVKVDPVEVYLASGADASKFQARVAEALSRYFERALKRSIGDAFPIVEDSGPLTLRLRSAIVGVEPDTLAADQTAADGETLEHGAKIGNVSIEMELVDSITGERIAAAVDKAALGTDAEVGAFRFERVEKYVAAREAFDEWAARIREFLDAEHQLSPEDARKASDAYAPYGSSSAAK